MHRSYGHDTLLYQRRQPRSKAGDDHLYAADVGKRVGKGHQLTDEQRDHIAALFEEWIARQPKTKRSHRAIAKAYGTNNAIISIIRNKKGGVGVNVLLLLRRILGRSIDDILGLPELDEDLATVTDADTWPNRRTAARDARRRGVPDEVIQQVRARYADEAKYKDRSRRWWEWKFQKAYVALLEDHLDDERGVDQ